MRGVVWLTLLFSVAVVAALTLGRNDGLVSLFWGGWRIDLSLNLFLLGVVAGCMLMFLALHAMRSLLTLPTKAKAWRQAQRERGAQSLLREALVHLWGGRYARAQRSVHRLLSLQESTGEAPPDRGALALAHLLAAEAAHRLQDRVQRQHQWDAALREALDGEQRDAARLQAVGWALEDRDANRALGLLGELPPGTARRSHAMRLRLQAARLSGQTLDALRSARLLTKHQAFAPGIGQSLVRSLALEWLDAARDADQLRQAWVQLEHAERRDPYVVARVALRSVAHGAVADARLYLRPCWDEMRQLSDEERAAVALATLASLEGLGVDWLARLESACQAFPRDPHVGLVMAHALAELQLWGKAKQHLTTAAADLRLSADLRRRTWLRLADMAEHAGSVDERLAAIEQAARVN